jgi:hypothetical protein
MTLAIYSDKGRAFFSVDDDALPSVLRDAVKASTGIDVSVSPPAHGTSCSRIAELSFQKVDDPDLYVSVAVEKPKVNRKPDADPGKSVAQSLIFDKEVFDLAGARQWIADNEGFGDYGVDETTTSYRFRQYDPEHFESFATKELTSGVTAVLGVVAGEQEEEMEADAEKRALDATPQDVRDLNEKVRKRGLTILRGSAVVHKAEDAEAEKPEEDEERYVLSMVLEPNDGTDGALLKPDTQDDIYSYKDIRKAAHRWMEHYGMVDLMHSWSALTKDQVRVLESYLMPADVTIGTEKVVKGSWMLGVRVLDDKLWELIKDGTLGAYSIGGTAVRTPIETEAEDGSEG